MKRIAALAAAAGVVGAILALMPCDVRGGASQPASSQGKDGPPAATQETQYWTGPERGAGQAATRGSGTQPATEPAPADTQKPIYGYQIVYVLDTSGSMAGSFDEIRADFKDSIRRLRAEELFHVVCFARDSYQELRAKRLVLATEENKRLAIKALDEIRVGGPKSSPIAALEVAFNAFRYAPPHGPGRVCHVVTSREFSACGYQYKEPGGTVLTGSEAIIAWVRANNKDVRVHVYPIILGPPPSAETKEFLKKLAEENGGRYKYVSSKPKDPG
jgi:Mg-chelatase subunit ChlD